MVIVGLTGGIATGKSSVAEMLRIRGMHIVDADLIARKVVEPGRPTYTKLFAELGDEFFDAQNGILNRSKLAIKMASRRIRSVVNLVKPLQSGTFGVVEEIIINMQIEIKSMILVHYAASF
ncbi:Dephospho-CoA kinase [Dictyocaulus viviparus]|uniref:Dephospho-CoA kinase n=1 Tax=Dictyocaulus viviparus TaxID=29172 RepID=A0A0D8XVK8_DICVI|nr:Dephospho-CoA kinase [Dictyocaulus viviparus]